MLVLIPNEDNSKKEVDNGNTDKDFNSDGFFVIFIGSIKKGSEYIEAV